MAPGRYTVVYPKRAVKFPPRGSGTGIAPKPLRMGTLSGEAEVGDLQQRVRRLREEGFLARVFQLAGGDTARRLNAGAIGSALGLPLEATLSIVESLREQELLHRCGRLAPPDGPEIHLTRRGAERARQAA